MEMDIEEDNVVEDRIEQMMDVENRSDEAA